jgi:hypothetical protein
MTYPRPPAPLRPASVLGALDDLLRAHGLTRLYGAACTLYGVLSVTYGLTVWTNGLLLWWRTPSGEETTWPAADPQGAARILTTQAHDPDTPQSPDGP